MYSVIPVIVEGSKNIYYLSPNDLKLEKNCFVVFETENGLQYGKAIKDIYKEKKENLVLPLDKVIRVATKEDKNQVLENKKTAEQALSDARRISKNLKLDMNFVDSYFTFDKSQLIFSFLSDNRVDFRELAKKLAQKYKTRIELRQIGVRDKAKKVGGLGPCGLFLCCNSFLTDFNSVSINMAKNQFLALNPTKINGMCGRLLCCLGYEDEVYTELKKGMPNIGMMADTEMGMGKVVNVDVFKGTYSVDLKDKGIIEFSKDEKMLVLNDIVGYKNRKIYQDDDTFSFCLDSLLLANFVKINLSDKKILDLGCGNGIIPLVISLKTKSDIIGVEIQKRLSDMAEKSVFYNKLENQIKIINQDMKDFSNSCNPNIFDIIVCNPPYFKVEKTSKKNISLEKSIARHELKITLSDIFCISKKLLKNDGRFVIIHRVERLSEILELFRVNNITPKRIQFVYQDVESSAKLVLIEGRKNAKQGLAVEEPIILYDKDKKPNDFYKSILEEVRI